MKGNITFLNEIEMKIENSVGIQFKRISAATYLQLQYVTDLMRYPI